MSASERGRNSRGDNDKNVSENEIEYEYESDQEFDDVSWEQEDSASPPQALEITIEQPSSAPAKKKARVAAQVRYKESDFVAARERAEAALVEHLERLRQAALWTSDAYLQALSQSLLPLDLASAPVLNSSNENDLVGYSSRVRAWAAQLFTVVASEDVTEEEGRDGSDPSELEVVAITRKAGSSAQLSQVLCALFLSQGIRCRLVSQFSLPSLAPHPPSHSASPFPSPPSPRCWLEVCVLPATASAAARWVSVDLSASASGQPQLPSLQFPSFVVAAEVIGRSTVQLANLSSKYLPSRYRFPTKRVGESFAALTSFLDSRIQATSSSSPLVIDLVGSEPTGIVEAGSRQEREFEAVELRKLDKARAAALPNTLADFRMHPTYVLERFLRANEVIHPQKRGQPVAFFRGEAVFPRDSVEELRTKLQWRRQMRTVRPGEVPVQCKQKRRRTIDSNGEVSTESVEWKLFGSWQTLPLIVPAVVDGVLPCNKYGNIEIWDELPQFVPSGAAYVPSPLARKAAQQIGIQCLPAVTGFEATSGRARPVFGGVVVLREHRDLLADCIFSLESIHNEKSYDKHVLEVLGRWKHLVRSLLSRQRLKEAYGH